MKRVLIIYIQQEISNDDIDKCKEMFECDIVFTFYPDNILEHTQYPYFETKIINWDDTSKR